MKLRTDGRSWGIHAYQLLAANVADPPPCAPGEMLVAVQLGAPFPYQPGTPVEIDLPAFSKPLSAQVLKLLPGTFGPTVELHRVELSHAEDATLSIAGPCPDCKGTGTVALFTSREPCTRCGGRSAPPRSADAP